MYQNSEEINQKFNIGFLLNIHYINPLLRYPVSGPVFSDLGKNNTNAFLKTFNT